METFAQLVKRLREQAGLAQKTLAEKSGLSESLISKYERDDKNRKASTAIRPKTLEMLADGLGLSTGPDRRLLFEVAWEREQRERTRTSELARLLEAIPNTTDEESKEGIAADRADDLRQYYSQPRVLERMEEVAECILWMLYSAPPLKKVGAGEILDTTQGSVSMFHYLGPEERWSRAVRSAMEHKWNVVNLYRMTGDLERAFEVIREIRNLSVYPEQYIPRYFRQIGELRPPFNILIVPHIGALLALSTHNPAVVDAAFFYPEKPEFAPYISSLTNHFNLLFTETVQLARTYKARSPEWEDTLTRICQLEADEFLANNYIDSLTMPPVLLDEWLKELLRLEKAYSAMAFRRLKTHHIQRREAFERHVRAFKYLTIMRRHSFTEVLQSENAGFYRYPVPHSPDRYITVDKRQVIEHLEYLIRDLRRYNNYEIALIADDHPCAKDIPRTPWRVKGEAAVLIEPYTESGDKHHLKVTSDLEITEPSVARAFRQEFITIWNEVADPDKVKHKENVIRELTNFLEEVKSKPEGSRD